MTKVLDQKSGDGWVAYNGDSTEVIKGVPSGSVGLSMFSPPFSTLLTYSASDRDMGNSRNDEQFFKHFEFLIPELLRISMPGRKCIVHCQEITTRKSVEGFIGRRDFPGEIVRKFQEHGWIYDGRITIDKDPQLAAQRSKSKQLLFVQKERDSNWLMSCLADYLLSFRHPGENSVPVKGDVSNEEWILWARPVWYGIRESDTLNVTAAREEKDERHLAPLQLETIRRAVRLWTNPGEVVFSPFGGVGSEGYVALEQNRKAVIIELKPSYWRQACRNLAGAKKQTGFAFLAERPSSFETDSPNDPEGNDSPTAGVSTEPVAQAPAGAALAGGSPAAGAVKAFEEFASHLGDPPTTALATADPPKKKGRAKRITVEMPDGQVLHGEPAEE